MDGWQHEPANTNPNPTWLAPARERPPAPPDGLDVPIFIPRVSQPPMNIAHDDPGDGLTLDTASSSKTTTASVWSFESMRDIHEFIREVNGRSYNAQNTTYFLPADQIEYSRLDKQHIRHCIALKGELYPRPEMVDFILRPEPGVEKKVLDIGCGSGIWTMSMANKFPHVDIIGIDLAPGIVNEDHVPINCRFELDDVNRGLPHFYAQMDLVHMRSVASGITNYAGTVGELVKCLKPGGMLILAEGDFEWYRENQVDFAIPTDPNCAETTQPGKTWLAQNALEVQKAQFSRGGDIMQAQHLVDRGLWDHPEMDPDSCGAISTFTPVGPWPQSTNPEERQRLGMAGTLERFVIRDFRNGTRNMLLEMGISVRVLDHWHSMAELELQNCSIPSVWVRFRYAWGHKMEGCGPVTPSIPVEGLAYRPIPPHLGGEVPPFDPFGPYGKYPQVHYYPTAERARQWAEWRAMERARLGIEPWPERSAWQ